MKKLLTTLLAICTIFCFAPILVSAQSEFNGNYVETNIEIVERFQDGSYIEVTITKESIDIMPLADSYIKSGTKTYTYRDSDGNKIWWYTLNGSFRVTTGASAVCTSALDSYIVQDDSWTLKESSTSKSGNEAIGNATFIKKVLFVTTDTKNVSITLTCDKSGNLS